MCQECTHNTQGECEGKTVDEARKDGKPPCKKYELDMSLLQDDPDDTPVEEQYTQNETQQEIFGVFGYDNKDNNVWDTHYNTFEEAKAAAVELAQELNSKDLLYVEVWQADEDGTFGVCGKPLWRQEHNEIETTDERIDNAKPIDNEVLPGTQETKHQKFKRLSKRRLHTALDNIRKLSNLTNKAVYEWAEADKEHIVSTIRKAIDKLENKL